MFHKKSSANKIIQSFAKKFEEPTVKEGFKEIIKVCNLTQINALLHRLGVLHKFEINIENNNNSNDIDNDNENSNEIINNDSNMDNNWQSENNHKNKNKNNNKNDTKNAKNMKQNENENGNENNKEHNQIESENNKNTLWNDETMSMIDINMCTINATNLNLQIICDKLSLNMCDVLSCYVVGSRYWGNANLKNSDWDFFIIIKSGFILFLFLFFFAFFRLFYVTTSKKNAFRFFFSLHSML